MKRTTPHNPIEPVLDRALCQLRAWRRADIGRAISVRSDGHVSLYEHRGGTQFVSLHSSVAIALAAIAKGKLKWCVALPPAPAETEPVARAKRATY